MNKDQMVASIVRLPNREDIDLEVEEHLIVELYSNKCRSMLPEFFWQPGIVWIWNCVF